MGNPMRFTSEEFSRACGKMDRLKRKAMSDHPTNGIQDDDHEPVTDFRSFVRWVASRRGKPGYGETMFRLAVLCLTAAFGVGVLLYIMFN